MAHRTYLHIPFGIMHSRFLLALVVLAGLTTSVFAQSFSATGTVVDSAAGTPLNGARVAFTRLQDSVMKGAVTDRQGTFTVEGLDRGRYGVRISFVGYAPFERTVTITNGTLRMGRIQLVAGGVQAEDVVVTERVIPMLQKGDTSEFNANAYKVNKDANADDLVQKMPGVTVVDGRVQAQGESVQRVLVDGRPFFGNDPNAALRNLPAEIVDKVQIYDAGSDQQRFTGFGDGNTTKTMNIMTRMGMRNGQFGRFTAGYGADDRYKASGTYNLFDNTQRITILAQSNNTNEQNFSIEDLFGGMMGGGSGGGGFMRRMSGMMGAMRNPTGMMGRWRGGGGGMSDFLVDQRNGVTLTHAAGLNYADKWGSNIDVSASYFVNYSDNSATQNLLRQFVIPTLQDQTYSQDDQTTSQNTNHRLNLRAEVALDTNTSFLLSPRLTLQQNDGLTSFRGNTLLLTDTLNRTTNSTTTGLTGINASNDLLFRHRFATFGRTFSVNINTQYNDNNGTNTLLATNDYVGQGGFIDTVDQQSRLIKDGYTIAPTVTYTEPLWTNTGLSLSYNASYNVSTSDRRTFTPDEPSALFVNLDTTLSNTFATTYFTQSVAPAFQWQDGEWRANAGVAVQRAELSGDRTFPFSGAVQRTFTNILPNASVSIPVTTDASLRFNYTTRTNAPSVDQMQNVLNNTNPLQLSIGDPNLSQDLSHNLSARYASSIPHSASSFFAVVSGSVTQDYIGNSTVIAGRDTIVDGINLGRGAQLSKPVNMDGFASVRFFSTYSTPIDLIKSNVNVFASYNLTRTPGMVNGVENIALAPVYTGGVVISSNVSEFLDFTVSTNISANQVRNSVRSDLNSDFLSAFSRFKWSWQTWGGIVLAGDVSHQLNKGYTEGFDQSIWLVNVSVAKKFLQNDRAEVRLSVNDALNQNNMINRNITDAYIEDTQQNILRRVILLTFSYSLRNFGTGTSTAPSMFGGPRDGRRD
ncbi:MAG: TonB-dependent receptor [Candidatus Kapabacteria bacterium]|nr:TonB-dependent receptor [Candidatus Kapabacteria bacterium]